MLEAMARIGIAPALPATPRLAALNDHIDAVR
jgi:hypothetical protein